MKLLNKIKTFDAYPKTVEDFRIRTTSGAAISILAGIFIVWLFVSEFAYYLQTEVNSELFVDTTRGEKLRINFDLTFHSMACTFLSVDAMDMTGAHQLDVDHNIFKTRISREGLPISEAVEKQELGDKSAEIETQQQAVKDPNYCGSCYGSEEYAGQCCNTCEEVQEAYRKKSWSFSNPEGIEQCVRDGFTKKLKDQKGEGCKIYGYLLVNKVAGNFHFAPGKSFQQNHMHVHDLGVFKSGGFNMSHTINKLSFGIEFPGLVNPLDGVSKSWNAEGSPMYQYFIKIVPTIYRSMSSSVISTNQFSVTEYVKKLDQDDGHGLPGVFMVYDLSPIMVRFTETQKSFAHFLTGICAIIGGVFSVAGIIDSFVYHSLRSFSKKVELGKAN
eukprot:TRINITY_DN480_c0_g1_i1.p1 TRINITY_DN480_c0_g1~~TRINITY_DN480_c0_g1_i1.p1  ORF type:complete len:386 (-),score=71.43 TRINITY_DN480_c0_g1_i1:13-1170(-)